MGYLRFLLASLVLASHAQVATAFAGSLAVECFFAISGFYIQMIASEQYAGQHHWKRKFWQSRALRIFVPYWTILFVILVVQFIYHLHRPHSELPLWSLSLDIDHLSKIAMLVFSNLFILGTESIKLMRIIHGCGYDAWQNIVIQPVWSVGIELMFYAAAPFILLRRTRVLAAVTLTCTVSKLILYTGQAQAIFHDIPCADGLLNGVFPLEIGVFTAGALGYRFYKKYLHANIAFEQNSLYYGLIIALSVLTLIANKTLAYYPMPTFQLYLIAVIAMVPFLFAASRNRRHDLQLAELSYAFYLSHYFMLWVVQKWGMSVHVTFLCAFLLTSLCAWLVNHFIETPLNRFRHDHFRKHRA